MTQKNGKQESNENEQIFMLFQDNVGKVVSKGLVKKSFATMKKILGENHVMEFNALRGMLFKLLPGEAQPIDKLYADFISIYESTHYLQITLDQMILVPPDYADYLMAVPSHKDRYDILTHDKKKLEIAKTIKEGQNILVEKNEVMNKGVLRYKGLMKKKFGIFFGVELELFFVMDVVDSFDRETYMMESIFSEAALAALLKWTPSRTFSSSFEKPVGENDGKHLEMQYFKCEPKHGIFVPVSSIKFCDTQYSHLRVGARYVLSIQRSKKVVSGVLKYLGKPDSYDGVIAGLELDKKLRSVSDRMTVSYSGKELFQCADMERYFLTSPDDLLSEDQFNPKKGDMTEEYEILTTVDGKSINGQPALKHEKIPKTNFQYEDPVKEQEKLFAAQQKDKMRRFEKNEHPLYSLQKNAKSKLSSEKNSEPSRNVTNIGISNESFADNSSRLPKQSYSLPGSTLLAGKDYKEFLKKDKMENQTTNGLPKESFDGLHNDRNSLRDSKQGVTASYAKALRSHSQDQNYSNDDVNQKFDQNKYMEDQNDFMSDVSDDPKQYPTANKDNEPAATVFEQNELQATPPYVPTENNEDLYAKPIVSSQRQYNDTDFQQFPDSKNSSLKNNNMLQVGSLVQVNVNKPMPLYGVLRWIGTDRNYPTTVMAGLELEESMQSRVNGAFCGTRYFTCAEGRGFFCKLENCKPDERFDGRSYSIEESVQRYVESVKGFIPPPDKLTRKYIGRDKGVQGHHNSCYMDATLFSMFSFSYLFDMLLYRKKRNTDIEEFDIVQQILREQIVNPLRKNGFVNHMSVMELRKYLNELGDIGGFLNEEKDPEEFINLLFEKVLKVDPFIKLRHDSRHEQSHLYQIFIEKNEAIQLPSIQDLFETSFLSSNLQLLETPSVMILQMPRFGLQKLYKRIQINPFLDITSVLSDVMHQCVICGTTATLNCRQCSGQILHKVFAFYCKTCYERSHQHPERHDHKQPIELPNAKIKPSSEMMYPSIYQAQLPESQSRVLMELFAVVCIKTSHYVSFTKCGTGEEASWVFFDSMADRHGGQNGYNIPEVSEINELNYYLNSTPDIIAGLHSKSDERILRLYEDASLCFYRNVNRAMYT